MSPPALLWQLLSKAILGLHGVSQCQQVQLSACCTLSTTERFGAQCARLSLPWNKLAWAERKPLKHKHQLPRFETVHNGQGAILSGSWSDDLLRSTLEGDSLAVITFRTLMCIKVSRIRDKDSPALFGHLTGVWCLREGQQEGASRPKGLDTLQST